MAARPLKKEEIAEEDGPVMGSGDFLEDMGYGDPEEARLKFLICNEFAIIAEDRNLTQSKIAEITGLAQPDVSRIINSNVDDYSPWRLMRALTKLGKNVTVVISEAANEHGQLIAMRETEDADQNLALSPSF